MRTCAGFKVSYGFIQTIVKATRIQGESASLIDHIVTNCTSVNFTTGSILADVSDHFPIFILNGKKIIMISLPLYQKRGNCQKARLE
jgi:hypothetical protein